MIRVLVVDDHTPTREAAVQELQSGGLIQVVGEAETSDEALRTATQLLPNMVLLDLHLPGLMQTSTLITKMVNLKNVHVIAYATTAKASEVQDLFELGASAYVVKTDPWPLIKMSILMVSRGTQGVISPALPKNLLRMTPQESAILKQCTKRGGIGKAAERMGLTEYDLTKLLEHIAEKLELLDADKLIKWAKKHGF